MAKGYIIEEVHVTGGSIRLRDSLTGKVVDVPLTPGSKLMLSGQDEVEDPDTEEGATDDDDEANAADDEAEAEAAEPEAKPAARRRRRRKARARKEAERRETNAEDVPALTVPRSRPVTEDPTPVVDESTLSDEDKAAVEQFRTLMSKRGKRGGLGWKEITVEGRSGLQARWGKGQFKILHTGGDSHALFYEWDGGKWERIACGNADDLMRLATARSEDDEQPKAPLTTLTLEVARMFCGTPDQQDGAKKRLRPVRNAVPREPEAAEPTPEAPRPPAEHAPSENEAKDQELMSSFTDELDKVLAEEDD